MPDFISGIRLPRQKGPLKRDQWGSMHTLLQRFLRDETGATAIEYGLIAAGISVAIITVVQGLATTLSSTFSNITTAIK
jgi:pilus assembly protein Flp/PilA